MPIETVRMVPDNHRVSPYFPLRPTNGRRVGIQSSLELQVALYADVARYQAIAARDMLAIRTDPALVAQAELAARRKREAERHFLDFVDGLEPSPDDAIEDDPMEPEPDAG